MLDPAEMRQDDHPERPDGPAMPGRRRDADEARVRPPARARARVAPVRTRRSIGGVARPLRVGLLDNMPESARKATERQFRRVLAEARRPVDLLLFTLADEASADGRYAPRRALAEAGLDALIVTGCEPRADDLAAEPYFPALAAVVDWAAENTVSTLFSCLAAHAAVLHLDGIARVPLPAKHWGVFPCERAAAHPLLDGAPETVPVPHSRWNDLPEAALRAAGYTVLRRSGAVGADLFVREAGSLFVFLQGHPEYDGDSLAKEHRRDVGRWLARARADCPPLPENALAPEAARRLAGFVERLSMDPATYADFPPLDPDPPARAAWQAEAARLFRNWLAEIERRRAPARDPARLLATAG